MVPFIKLSIFFMKFHLFLIFFSWKRRYNWQFQSKKRSGLYLGRYSTLFLNFLILGQWSVNYFYFKYKTNFFFFQNIYITQFLSFDPLVELNMYSIKLLKLLTINIKNIEYMFFFLPNITSIFNLLCKTKFILLSYKHNLIYYNNNFYNYFLFNSILSLIFQFVKNIYLIYLIYFSIILI